MIDFCEDKLFFPQIGELLIKRGVNPGALDSTGATPLHYAAYNAHFSLCKLFVGEYTQSENFVTSNTNASSTTWPTKVGRTQ